MAEKSGGKKVRIETNGPYHVSGGVPLSEQIIITDEEGHPVKWEEGKRYPRQEKYRLCRCGGSRNKPFCDDSHIEISFDGAETAERKPYLEQAERTEGPDLDLTDAVKLCALLRFCINKAGEIWDLTEKSDDPAAKKVAIQQAFDCAAGRLTVWDKKTGEPIEPELEPSIGLVKDPAREADGPLWIKGGIPVESADGENYEIRNRVTLCRCGRSGNKPFCDGSHLRAA